MNSKRQIVDRDRRRLAVWLAAEMIPNDADVRRWLSTRLRAHADVDDIMQEAYARFAALTAFEQVIEPRRYFFRTVRHLLIDHVRRQQVVQIDAVADIDAIGASSDQPCPEQTTAARRELDRVRTLIEALPARCRQIFKLRKIEGFSQREIAIQLSISESIVENEGVRGLRLIMNAMREQERDVEFSGEEDRHGRPAKR